MSGVQTAPGATQFTRMPSSASVGAAIFRVALLRGDAREVVQRFIDHLDRQGDTRAAVEFRRELAGLTLITLRGADAIWSLRMSMCSPPAEGARQ